VLWTSWPKILQMIVIGIPVEVIKRRLATTTAFKAMSRFAEFDVEVLPDEPSLFLR